MRKFITLLIVAISLISCSSDEDDKVRNSEFVGKWNWIGSHGGFSFNIHSTPESEGYTLQLNLMKNYTFSLLKDGKEVGTGKYDLIMVESINTGEMGKYITCDMSTTPHDRYFVTKGIITISEEGKLSISDNNFDGIGSGFERIK
ncbi:hypothetical protein SAMN05444397_104326 [Flavobacterium aquidurense]|uniref:Lipocalin-like domain-containing protein n=1 Tax=Flavobacterium frigidimaris TaxID=262320 RepID=A0ABX4BMP5_FLAFR|nr:hypothetical protein [Flavobacterium frigidimaris]OXA77051.1 hypothetical protein B0A65_17240 [Flavobacterium frigidimaris]SDZ24730.1 hypothetical protein SAMN05444397_104326 [Flavobacterium aquidurense]